MKYISLLSVLQAQDISNKKKPRKNIEEIKKELLESIVEEGLEDDELIQNPENILNLQEAVACVGHSICKATQK